MWYFEELTKYNVYSCWLNTLQVLLKIAGRRMLDCIHSPTVYDFGYFGTLWYFYDNLYLTFVILLRWILWTMFLYEFKNKKYGLKIWMNNLSSGMSFECNVIFNEKSSLKFRRLHVNPLKFLVLNISRHITYDITNN